MMKHVMLLLIVTVFGMQSVLAGDPELTTRPPPAGSAGSAPADIEIPPVGGGKVELEPIEGPTVSREDAPGNKFMHNPACDRPNVNC